MSRIPTIHPVPYYAAYHSSRLGMATSARLAGGVRKFAHGAGSALLAFAGADSLTSSARATPSGEIDLSTIDGLMQSFLSGGLAGPLQIAGAAFLFLAAGRCAARMLGLLAAAGVIVLYLQGVTVEDAAAFATRFGDRMIAAHTAFVAAESG